MGRIGEGVLAADLLAIDELESRRNTATKVFEDAFMQVPILELGSSFEYDCPSVIQAIGYAECAQVSLIRGTNGEDSSVDRLVKENPLNSVELCFGFLHYLGISAIHRVFEDSPVLANKVDDEARLRLKYSMLDNRANLRARVYDTTLHHFGYTKDGPKYKYIKHIADEALRHLLDLNQSQVSQAVTKNCLSGILAEQKVYVALFENGHDVRFATHEEELRQVDVIADGVPLQVKGNSAEDQPETRFVIKNRDTTKVIVSTNSSFPRFKLGAGSKALGRLVSKQASVYN